MYPLILLSLGITVAAIGILSGAAVAKSLQAGVFIPMVVLGIRLLLEKYRGW